MVGAKSLERIRFNKAGGFVRVYDGTRYLVLFSQKSGITYVFFSHNHAKIKSDSYDSLPLEKALSLHNVIIRIKSVFNKDQNYYNYNVCIN